MMKHSIVSGLPVLLVGALMVAIASTYPIGTAMRMGPGYFPMACGFLLLLCGAFIIAFDKEKVEEVGAKAVIRPMLAVFGGLIAWAAIAPRFGLVPATFALVGIVAFAQPRPSLPATVATATLLAGFGVVVFLMGLNIRLSAVRFF